MAPVKHGDWTASPHESEDASSSFEDMRDEITSITDEDQTKVNSTKGHSSRPYQHEYLSMRRGSSPPPVRAARRSSSPTSIVLEVPAAYKMRRSQEEPNHLPITNSWLFRGIKSHVGDLHLPDIVSVGDEVAARSRIEVLCEYTWINITPSQESSGKRFPAIYVPGRSTFSPFFFSFPKGGNLFAPGGGGGDGDRDWHLLTPGP